MDTEKASRMVERLMYLSRGTPLQARLWILHEICNGDRAFVAAAELQPKLLNLSLKIAMASGRRRIEESDIKAAKQRLNNKNAKNWVQASLFELGETVGATVVKAVTKIKKVAKKARQFSKTIKNTITSNAQQCFGFGKWHQYPLF